MIPFVAPLIGIVAILVTNSIRQHDPRPQPSPTPPAGIVREMPAVARCEPPPTDQVSPTRPAEDWTWLSPVQHDLAIQLVAIFENRELELQYSYVEYLGDGRGFTSGIVGFTTGTSDALLVVEAYDRIKAREGRDSGALGRTRSERILDYLPELQRIDDLDRSDERRDNVDGLDGYEQAWVDASEDPLFREAQDSIFSQLYYVPALRLANTVNIRSGFGRAQILDAIIQHGGGDDPDGLPAMLAATAAELGTPTDWDQEWNWMNRFIEIRDSVLNCAHGEATREAWRESRTRVDVYRQILEAGNLDFSSPLTFQLDSREWVITAD